MIRAVVDCNVFVSALLAPEGPPGDVVRGIAAGSFEVVLSPAIAEELRRTIRYPKVRKALRMTEEEVDLWVSAIEVLAVYVDPREVPQIVSEDPSDDIYIGAALESRAEFIVSGDSHLLDVGEYQSVGVVTPRTFLDVLKGEGQRTGR